jgi:hypothetical protein
MIADDSHRSTTPSSTHDDSWCRMHAPVASLASLLRLFISAQAHLRFLFLLPFQPLPNLHRPSSSTPLTSLLAPVTPSSVISHCLSISLCPHLAGRLLAPATTGPAASLASLPSDSRKVRICICAVLQSQDISHPRVIRVTSLSPVLELCKTPCAKSSAVGGSAASRKHLKLRSSSYTLLASTRRATL